MKIVMRPRILALIAALILTGLACTIFAPLPPAPSSQPTAVVVTVGPRPTPLLASTPLPVPTVVSGPIITSSDEQLLIELYQRVNPSVVAILVESDLEGGSLGSGFVIDTEGHVVTNYHVVQGATGIEVDFASGYKARARLLGSDADSDLAVLQVDAPAEQLIPVPLADSDQVQVGQRVVAIGNPFGYFGTMTVGIVSGLGRDLPTLRESLDATGFRTPDIIQTDAAINRGNSGGPLLNLQGQVIGVNKALESETGENSGVGFAIASNTVRQIAPFLISEGRFVYPYLGIQSVSLQDVSLSLQEQLGLVQATGAYVTSLVAGGPAAQSGLRGDSAPDDGSRIQYNGDGDLIVAIDGRAVRVFNDLIGYLVNHKRPGDEVTLTVLRGGQQVEVKVILGERP
jgi:S1-C subfamily serine protease